MSAILARLPLQLVCQLIIPETPAIGNTNFAPAVNPNPLPEVLPGGYVAYSDVGAAYKVHNDSVSWLVARKRCMQNGAHLALIDSAKKLEYVIRQKVTPNKVIHVGIHSLFDDDEWVSAVDGKSVTSIPWKNGEPYGDYKCVMVRTSGDGLSNDGCGVVGNYVCEIPIPKS